MPDNKPITDDAQKKELTGRKAETVNNLRKRHVALLSERTSWVNDWRTLAKYFHPRRFRALDEEGTSNTNEGNLLDTLVDNESVRAMRVLAAGMQGGMTSPARPWFKLGIPEPDLEEQGEVKEWLAQVQRIMLNTMARSNFYDSVHTLYSELATFGCGCIFALEDPEHVVRYRTLTAGEFCFIQGPEGRVHGVFRMVDMTAEQIVQKFGESKCSTTVRTAAKDEGSKDKWFQVVHVVLPNPKRDPNVFTGQGKAYESFYYEYAKDSEQKQHAYLLAYGGFDTKPFAGPRWDIIGSDIYGRGPAMDTLNDVRQLQSMVSSLLKALHKQADPPMVAPSELWDVNTVPGGINYVDTNNKEALRPLYQTTPNLTGAAGLIEQVRTNIREGLYNDLFKMLALAERPNMTATEVKQRVEEKLIQLGPVIERLHAELLDVLIDRTFEICLRRGLFPPAPDALQGKEVKVEYISLLAQAQKLVGTSSIDQFMGLIGTFGELFPEMMDIPDVDEVAERYADMLGVDPAIIRPMEEREERREARNAQAQEMAQMEQLQAGAQVAKDVGQASPDGTDPLQGLVQP